MPMMPPMPPEAALIDPHGARCFGCGPDNPAGLALRVFRVGDEVLTDVVFDDRHAGAHGVAHGGVVATACDDLMAFLLYVVRRPAVTRSLQVDYLRPVPVGEPHRVVAHVAGSEGRRLNLVAQGSGSDGTVRFTARAVFVDVDAAHFERLGATDTSDAVRRLLPCDATAEGR